MRRSALTLLALSAPMLGLLACAEPSDDRAPISATAPFFTTSPEYFARPQAYLTESTYLTGAPFYTSNLGYYIVANRPVRHGYYCPPGGHGHAHKGGRHR